MYTTVDFDRIRGAVAFDRSGLRIGDVGEVFLDDQTGVPIWVSIHTGLFGRHHSLVPLEGSHLEHHGRLVFPHDRDVVKDAPRVDEHGHLEKEQEDALYEYYAVPDPHEDMASAQRRTRRWIDDGGPLREGD
ncbi:MAG TPA: hypothetical protein GXZ45_05940 [Propionibacterium sp.]|nr:hypothetical protein [Propionibacterium sp.]